MRVALLVNPVAGRGRSGALATAVAERLGAGGVHVTRLQGADAEESAALARSVVSDRYDALLTVGGDGMVHLALQAVAGTPTALGVIPTGTGNDVARSLGVPRRRPLDAADVVLAGVRRRVDLGRANGVYFATVLAAGFDSLVSERAHAMSWPGGQLRYTLATLAVLRVFRPASYTLTLDGERLECAATLVAVGNSASYGGGLRMCEGARLDDGLLDLVVIDPVSRLELAKVYPRLFTGSHVRHPAYRSYRVRTAEIAAAGIVAYADGERITQLPVSVEVVPGAVEIFAPPR